MAKRSLFRPPTIRPFQDRWHLPKGSREQDGSWFYLGFEQRLGEGTSQVGPGTVKGAPDLAPQSQPDGDKRPLPAVQPELRWAVWTSSADCDTTASRTLGTCRPLEASVK